MSQCERSDKSRQHATPRTDRFDPRCGRDEGKDDALTSWLGIVTISGPDYERLLDHARQLERELAERTDSLVETAAHASKLMDERDSMKVAQSSSGAASAYGPDGRGVATGTVSATGAASGSNYVCDHETFPQKVTFANGRVVKMIGQGHLSIGWDK